MNRIDHLVGIGFEEAGEQLELLIERLGPELAERVAEVGAPLAGRTAHPRSPDQPVGSAQGLGTQLLFHLVAGRALGAKIGAHHAALGIRRAVVNVDQERPDPVAQLARDAVTLIGKEPARLIGRGVGVVGCREDNLVEPPVAEGRRAVAAGPGAHAVDAHRRWSGQHQRHCDHRQRQDHPDGHRHHQGSSRPGRLSGTLTGRPPDDLGHAHQHEHDADGREQRSRRRGPARAVGPRRWP